jgi:membrane-anchored mycosin MYCP
MRHPLPALAAMSAALITLWLAPAARAAVLAAPPAHHHGHARQGSPPAISQCTGPSSAVSRATPWAQQLLQPSRVWTMTRGAGQVVAVLDSGVSVTAPALAGAVLRGLNVLSGGPGDVDCTGHGTFVAGIIAARPTPGSGFAGLAPQARILPVIVVGSGPNDSVTASALANGIRYAVSNGATVIDVSTATTPSSSPALRAAVAYAAARNVVVIAPVGSNGLNQANQVSYPAAYPGVLAVAAADPSGAPITAGTPGVRVDIAAPGSGVLSIGPRGRGQLTGSGADLATGFVAGTAALVRSYYPRLSATQIVHRLEVTADSPGVALPDPQLGYGMIDPYTAITTVLPEESGGLPPATPAARPLHLAPLPVPDTGPTTAALIVTMIVAVGVAAAFGLRGILRQGGRHRLPGGEWGERSP